MTKLNISLGSTALTTPQSLALSSAAERDGGGLVLPARLKGKAAQSLVAALIEKGLAREIRAKPGMPICRRDTATGRSYALVITKLGRTSIQPQQAEVISPETAAIKVVPVAKHDSSKMEAPATSTDPELCPASPTTSNAPRQGSKLAGVMALLFRETGASIEELTAATGWLPHTTRAALTGLRKRGYTILREQRGLVTLLGHGRTRPMLANFMQPCRPHCAMSRTPRPGRADAFGLKRGDEEP